MKKLLTLAAGLAMAATMSAQVTFTCTAGAKYGEGEGIQKLFDDNVDSKYCGNVFCARLIGPLKILGKNIT